MRHYTSLHESETNALPSQHNDVQRQQFRCTARRRRERANAPDRPGRTALLHTMKVTVRLLMHSCITKHISQDILAINR